MRDLGCEESQLCFEVKRDAQDPRPRSQGEGDVSYIRTNSIACMEGPSGIAQNATVVIMKVQGWQPPRGTGQSFYNNITQ